MDLKTIFNHVVAGEYCEHQATDYCVALDEKGNQLFCTNFGKCPFETKKQTCDCRGGYYGVHCEYLATVEGPPSLEEIPPSEDALPTEETPPLIYDETRPCSATNECMYNSTCLYKFHTGDPFCDCSTATKGPNAEETLCKYTKPMFSSSLFSAFLILLDMFSNSIMFVLN